MHVLEYVSGSLVLWGVIIGFRAQDALYDLKFSAEVGKFSEMCVAVRTVRLRLRHLSWCTLACVSYCLTLWSLKLLHGGAFAAVAISSGFTLLTWCSRSNMHFALRQAGYEPKSMDAAGIIVL